MRGRAFSVRACPRIPVRHNVLQGDDRTDTAHAARLEHFKLRDAVAKNYHNGAKIVNSVPVEETKHTLLSGDQPKSVVSADDFLVLVHLPGALRGKTLVSCSFGFRLEPCRMYVQHDVTEAIEEWGRAAKPSAKGANDMKDCYKREYDLVGRTRLATLWHPVGHKVSNLTDSMAGDPCLHIPRTTHR